MAYDSESDRVIMFGGELEKTWSFKTSDETWAYDVGANVWEQMSPSLRPAAIAGAGMAYDSESDRIIMFGGSDADFNYESVTWAYDYNTDTWTEQAPGPEGREGVRLAYDSESDRIVLFGGVTGTTTTFHGDTWAYDFNSDTWERLEHEDGPSPRAWHNMAYDAESDRAIVWEGERVPDSNVWAYDYNTNTWTEYESDVALVSAFYEGFGAMAYDSESDRAVSFGGGFIQGSNTFDVTLAYDLNTNTWTEMSPDVVPGKRTAHEMVYNSLLDLIVMFGGRDGVGEAYSAETWTFGFNTNTWTNMALGQE